MFKILSAVVGFFIAGMSAPGAVIGFLVGYFIDKYLKNSAEDRTQQNPFDYYTSHVGVNDFASMLMVLSAAVMRADGRPLKSELNFIKSFFRQQFGNQFTVKHLQVLKYFLKSPDIPLQKIGANIQLRTKLEDRMLLLHYLFGIANADQQVAASEVQVIQEIAGYLGIPHTDFVSIKNMFFQDVDSDYKILGIESSATEQEIKSAYRQMALRYHPDRVAHLGEEYQKRAREKFEQIQQAYENIKKQRGIS